MWPNATLQDRFAETGRLNMRGEFGQTLLITDAMLKALAGDEHNRLYAYVLGCRRAVALRCQGRIDEAEKAFSEAYELAMASLELTIAAYIRHDWAYLYDGAQAEKMVREAFDLLDAAEAGRELAEADEERINPAVPEGGSPDPERHLEADRAYFSATLACILHSQGNREEAYTMLAAAANTLREYAYGTYPRYRDAYLLVLTSGMRLSLRDSLLPFVRLIKYAAILIGELVRQRMINPAMRFLWNKYLLRK